MIDKIIELLPSKDLKAKIKQTNHQFKENELLQIIYNYAPDFYTRIELLEQFAEIASSDVSALAKAYIEYEQDTFKHFRELSEGFIYELCVKETPGSYEEKYLCASYESALVCIDRYYEEYADVDAKETNETRYEIVKRKVFAENDSFEEDAYWSCELGPSKKILKIYDYKSSSDCDLDNVCSECNQVCIHRCDDVLFPCFVCNYAIIKYYDHKGKECFGVNICLHECDGFASVFYVIPLDSSEIKEHRFEDNFYAHKHIELPLATLVTPDELEETMRSNYFDFIDYLETNQ